MALYIMVPPWRHLLCDRCYAYLEPGRRPVKLAFLAPAECCRCGKPAPSPIFYRALPDMFPCRGRHLIGL